MYLTPKVVLLSKENAPDNFSYCFDDLDNDGNSEKLEYVLQTNGKLGLLIYTKGKLIEQWNFLGKVANSVSPFYADYDNDGIKEVFLFTTHNDSIYLHCLDAFNNIIEIEDRAICKVYKDGGIYDFTIYPCAAYDVDLDGYKEIFFSISTGFSTRPRNMFAYYPQKDSLFISPQSCSLVLFPQIFDLEGKGKPVFMGNIVFVTGNCELDRKYTDQYSWMMVFTPEMKLKFPALRFDVHPAVSWFIPFNTDKKNYILALHLYKGTENYPSFIALIDSSGKIIRKRNVENPKDWYYTPLFFKDKDYKTAFVLQSDGVVMSIDSMLNMQKVAELKDISNTHIILKKDIDCDGQNEFIFPGKNVNELIVYRNDFSDPVTLKFSESALFYQMSIIEKEGAGAKIFVDTGKHLYTFSYEITFLYRYRFTLFIPVFLFFLFVRFVIIRIKKYQKLKFDNTQKQISELQLKSALNQLDPHFTFNIFTSFANLINEHDTERANYIFNKYARLLKANVLNSESIHISLQEELDFVASYLELEKFRYTNKFSFQISIAENIDKQLLVPKMLIHIFVENSIKHGLKHLDKGGKLVIDGTRNKGKVIISVADNGIGRIKAKEYGNFSTGRGLLIMDKILDYYYKQYKLKIAYKIIDLYEGDTASGTEVKIYIPLLNR